MKKRNIALILSSALLISALTACQDLRQLPVDSSTSSEEAETTTDTTVSTPDSVISSPDEATSSTDTSSQPVEDNKPVSSLKVPFVDKEDNTKDEYVPGLQYLTYENTIYNNNATYEVDERYAAKYEKTDKYSALWYESQNPKYPDETYNADDAIAYAKVHWCDGVGLCAPFISRCMEAGGISAYSDGSTQLCMQLLNSGLGFGQFLPINEDRTVTLPSYARLGDVIQVYCPYEGLMIHSLLFGGNDENGHMKVYCHNFRNDASSTFYIDPACYDDEVVTDEVFFFHFYNEDDNLEEMPELYVEGSRVILAQNGGYDLIGEYDREAAVNYAKDNLYDGFGMSGAMDTSACLYAGGLNIGYPSNNALIFQLMRSGLGSAFSININNDRTVSIPDTVKAGDVFFYYCPYDGVMMSSAIIAGRDADGKLIAYSTDSVNDGKSAFKIADECIGCGSEVSQAVIFCFND